MMNKHVQDWLSAWNKHDLISVLSMYSDDIEFSSPKIKVVFPERGSSKVTNKKDLEEYWTRALEKYPKLNFELKESIFYSSHTYLVEYYALLDQNTKTSVIEKFVMQDGLIIKSSAYYGADEPI